MPVWRELALLALLLLLASGLRAWLIGHTEVAARDIVGFIRYALELERYPWKDVLERNLQHPGYPFALLAVSWPVRHVLGGTNCISMQLSAQLTSALAGVLLTGANMDGAEGMAAIHERFPADGPSAFYTRWLADHPAWDGSAIPQR